MSNPKQYLPWIYNNVREMDELMATEQLSLNELEAVISKWWANQYIPIADEDGIKVYEDQIGIIANPATEDLEFRRRRLLNRYSLQPPFTMRYLRIKLDEIIGVGKWNAWVDNEAFTLYIESSAENQNWFSEVSITINSIKPANIIFINKPTVYHTLLENETVLKKAMIWNYRLGTQWVLGQKPFLSYAGEEVVVLASTPSITDEMLNKMATFTASEIKSVRINKSYSINSFVTKQASRNVITIEYDVQTSSGITSITQIELLDAGGKVLTNNMVYIPLAEGVRLKHTILVKEGL